MIKRLSLLLLLAACSTQAELPEDFDPTFQFFLPNA